MIRTVAEQYNELMHYTTVGGLEGILSSGCLWATHAAFLNDSEEIKHYFDVRLCDVIQDSLELLTDEPSIAQKFRAVGGEKVFASKMTSEIRKHTLNFNAPYIFSMSAPRKLDVSNDGLLSQWRGYGVDGGYAIVFDPSGIEQLLDLENKMFNYQHMQWGDVHYYGRQGHQPSTSDIEKLEYELCGELDYYIRNDHFADGYKFYKAITSLSCLHKHCGFYEENEVRIVAVPANQKVVGIMASSNESKPAKQPEMFLRFAHGNTLPRTVCRVKQLPTLSPYQACCYRTTSRQVVAQEVR